ncbi:hypothetical protein CGZ92_07345 [Parenemella sanctibonifatiensis]|uniref:AB hydrolase-1 domain-containing protein n=2 Tax=Parenemella sanctibonifatiensis TaxID=2016505 RepID=A0A255E7J1_9ACTN|nr:hypothetical protein CGZ92_07345 [Parenemella sanctibonifatiensis]
MRCCCHEVLARRVRQAGQAGVRSERAETTAIRPDLHPECANLDLHVDSARVRRPNRRARLASMSADPFDPRSVDPNSVDPSNVDPNSGEERRQPPKPLVVLIHGEGQMPTSWQSQVEALADDFQLAAPWIRGLRPGAKDDFDMARAASDLMMLPISHGVGSMHVVGLSLGGTIALRIALEQPDLVDRLVLVNTHPEPSSMQLKVQAAALKMMSRRRLAAQGINKDAAQAVLKSMAADRVGDRLGEIQADTLVIASAGDRNRSDAATRLATTIPGATMELLAGGQLLNSDNPDGLNDLLVRFLKP